MVCLFIQSHFLYILVFVKMRLIVNKETIFCDLNVYCFIEGMLFFLNTLKYMFACVDFFMFA